MDSERNTIQAADPKLVGIGGWLIFPAIGLVLTPILEVVRALSFSRISDEQLRQITEAGYSRVLWNIKIAEIGLFAFIIYAAIRFFRKKSNAPAVMIANYALQLGGVVLLVMTAHGTRVEEYVDISVWDIVGGVIGAAIWIPYFLISKRVKATFIN